MKKKNLKSLKLNKKVISNVQASKVEGGYFSVLVCVTFTCVTVKTCVTCTCTKDDVCIATASFIEGILNTLENEC